jgi:NAD+ synthase (glutamine-hydrolysing)
MTDEALAGARLVLNISASPYQAGKGRQREQMIAQRARDTLAAVAFCALVGGQDELVFDGHSFVVDHDGDVIARAPQFAEELLVCDVDVEAARRGRLRDTRARPAAREWPRGADLGSFTTARRGPAAPGGRSPSCSTPTPRSTRRSCSARATTCARTASSTSSSGSRAGSTRRWSRSSPSTPSGPSA